VSPRATFDIRSTSAMTRQLHAADPSAARTYAARCRAFAADRGARAETDRDRRIAAALHRAADAAEAILLKLEGVA
jgi:hypothetical protein